MIFYLEISGKNALAMSKEVFEKRKKQSSGKVRIFDYSDYKFYFLTDGHQSDFINQSVMNRYINWIINSV